ncbi:ABC transporter ATP-binding protein [Ktedonobacter sp. SOSP1-52]|uniref:ABC transporter ATP-binding protein n=1 Tax=Ktedonobacter sp. SOSP1-52 TaxID=2778366 RepID=UPI001916AE73|nr:ABC transporter ATP-binding protein [Ktedonobacter sp. SOSP1-52]GHO69322.1 ABC transporter ATP-binding protein [Ktedonobacter sp. SOSP1-52]
MCYTSGMLDVSLSTQLDIFTLDVSFAVPQGTTTVLLGESGAGKSTVLRLLAGLLQPQAGHIILDKQVYYDNKRGLALPPQARPFGYVFQEYMLFPHLTVFENIAFGLRAQAEARSRIRLRVAEALAQVHLEGYAQRYPAQLSGGQQQRVALARALVLQPQLLLLDEPLSALDVQTRREIRQELRRILTEAGITTVFVTHQYVDALVFGQHILVLDQGQVLQQGSQLDLAQQPRSAYVAELVGMNFLHGRLLRTEDDGSCVVRIAQSQPALDLTVMFEERQGAPPSESEIYVVVEPRDITLHPGPPESSARNSCKGRIVQLLHLPSPSEGRVRVSMAVDGVASAPISLTAEITASSAARLNLHEGQEIYASFKASAAHAYM